MYHYTYLITYLDSKLYMGVRSCKKRPTEDTKYIGSSKYTPDNTIIKKDILAEYPSRKLAVTAEIKYHEEHNVGVNPLYYNKSKQTSTKFDTTGTIFTQTIEHREKIRIALTGRKRSTAECEAISKGQMGCIKGPMSAISKQRKSSALTGKAKTPEHITNAVAARMKNGSYFQSNETKKKISHALLKNPPYVTKVLFIQEGIKTVYRSIIDCSRDTGISNNTLLGRLKRKPACTIKGWSIEKLT